MQKTTVETEYVMTGQQAIQAIDRLLEQGDCRKINDLESTILLQIWEGNTYRSIADRLSYDLDYIKQVAARLWKTLSKLLGTTICKSNIRSSLELHYRSTLTAHWSRQTDYLSDIYHVQSLLTSLQIFENWLISDRITTAAFNLHQGK